MEPSRHLTRPLTWLGLAVLLALGLLATGALRQARASAPLRPNLVADPPDTQEKKTSSLEGKNQYLLRFNGYVHNNGNGALDFRGRREAPKVNGKTPKQVEEAVEQIARFEQKGEQLPPELQQVEAELAVPKMSVFQRLFTTEVGQQETNIEREHIEETSSGEMVYVSADGHDHWHLNHVAYYSLWNAAKSSEVAPAMKVGFCLEDSEHEDKTKGPSSPVYADSVAPFRDFCQQYHPNATSLFEGISPGWRDAYKKELAFQWVNVSNVLPGDYWLREDINPLHFIEEEGSGEKAKFATEETVVPGYDAAPQSASANAGEAKIITLASRGYEEPKHPLGAPKYTIVSAPKHGALSAVSKNQVTYTPEAGYSGPDEFKFSAAEPSSPFPEHPAIAAVSVEVLENAAPSVTIEGAPPSLEATTSVQLSAHVSNDGPTVTWSTSAGSITSGGLYTAPAEPPAGGTATVTATSEKGAKGTATIEIAPAVPRQLLIGNAGTGETIPDQTPVGHEEAFQFTAASTGVVEELQFRTDGIPNTGVSGVALGIFAEGAGEPAALLGSASAPGSPPTEAWIRARGLSTQLVKGTRYWLAVLPTGAPGAQLHYAASTETGGGTGDLESNAGGLTALVPESAWTKYNQGPVAFQALGEPASVTIEGLGAFSTPVESGVQLSARVVGDSPGVTWKASAGTITPEGLFTAPSTPGVVTITATTAHGVEGRREIEITTGGPAPTLSISGEQAEMYVGTGVTLTASVANDSGGVAWETEGGGSITEEGEQALFQAPTAPGTVTVRAHLKDRPGVTAQVAIKVIPAPAPAPAPEIPTGRAASGGSAGFRVSSPAPGVLRPRAMLIGRHLIMTTLSSVAGRIRLSAYLRSQRIGTCVAQTPAGRSFTCRLTLPRRVSPHARISVVASLRAGSVLVSSRLAAARIPQMTMVPTGFGARAASTAGTFWCSPSTLVPTLASTEG
jgi:hypothetical protein